MSWMASAFFEFTYLHPHFLYLETTVYLQSKFIDIVCIDWKVDLGLILKNHKNCPRLHKTFTNTKSLKK